MGRYRLARFNSPSPRKRGCSFDTPLHLLFASRLDGFVSRLHSKGSYLSQIMRPNGRKADVNLGPQKSRYPIFPACHRDRLA